MAGIKITKDETFDGYVTEKVNVIKNDLLGDYNENGKYIINEKVVLELLQLQKVKHSTFNNSIFCTSYMPGYGEITFELELKKQGNNGIAVIYVLEKVDKVNGYIQNTLRTQVAIYKDVLTPNFIERSFEGFNIKRREDQDQKSIEDDMKESFNTYIGVRKHFSELMNNITTNDYNTMYQEYFNQRIAMLKGDNSAYAKLILSKYGAEYDKIKDYFLKNEGAVDYKALNELLDKCFEDVNGLDPKNREKEEEFKKKMIPYLHALIIKAQTISEKGKKQVVEKAKANEKKKLAEVAKDKEKVEKSKDKPQATGNAKDVKPSVKFNYAKPKPIDHGPNPDEQKDKEHNITDNVDRLRNYIESSREGKVEVDTTDKEIGRGEASEVLEKVATEVIVDTEILTPTTPESVSEEGAPKDTPVVEDFNYDDILPTDI